MCDFFSEISLIRGGMKIAPGINVAKLTMLGWLGWKRIRPRPNRDFRLSAGFAYHLKNLLAATAITGSGRCRFLVRG